MMPSKENNHAGLFGESDDDHIDDTDVDFCSLVPNNDTTGEVNSSTNDKARTRSREELEKIKDSYRSSKLQAGLFGEPEDDDAYDYSPPFSSSRANPRNRILIAWEAESALSTTPKGDTGLFGEGESDDAMISPRPMTIGPSHNNGRATVVDSHVTAVNVAFVDEFIVAHPVPQEQAPIVHAALQSLRFENQVEQTMENDPNSKSNNISLILLALAFLIFGLIAGILVGLGFRTGSPTLSRPTTAPSQAASMTPYGTGSLGEWAFCNTSSQCANGCCSSRYSLSDGKLKCTPVGGYKSDICTPPAPESGGYLDEWAFCNTSAQCANGCCSRTYSISDGKLKCTPIGGFDPNICISSDWNSSFPILAPLASFNYSNASFDANVSLYVGRYVRTWSLMDDDGAIPELDNNGENTTNLTFSVAFSGWGDIYAALIESENVYPFLQGERYISVGGGNENGYWNTSVLSRLNEAIGQGALDAYVGIVYDIEEGDSGLLSMFRDSFATAKSKGFKVIVTYSHSAPYGIEDASVLMEAFLLETNINALSPQLYTTGNEANNEYSELANVAWSDYYDATPAIIPSLVNGGRYFMDAQEFFETEYSIQLSGYIQWTQN